MSELPWMAEAKKHIGQKEIKGPKHNSWIVSLWKAIKRGGIKDDETAWCFPGETEVLTSEGFIRFDQLGEEEVYQVDENGGLSLTKPIRKIQKDYDGEMIHINHRSLKVSCDTGHRWWGHWGKASEKPLTFKTLDKVTADGLQIPPCYSTSIGLPITDEDLRLLAAFISDGKYKYSNGKIEGPPWSIDFEVSKPRKVSALRKLGPDHEYTQAKVYGSLTKVPLTVFRFIFPEFINTFTGEYKVLNPRFINGLSQRQARVYLEAYSSFDGSPSDISMTLFTSNPKVRDNLIIIATLAGYLPSVQLRHNKSPTALSPKPSWVICVDKTKKTRCIRKTHLTRTNFVGKLYCVEVPHGRIVVRGLNGVPTVTGNCAAYVGACFEAVNIQSTRFESARSYEKWGIPLTYPVYGSVAVLTRPGGGGHVMFVMGQDSKGNILGLGGNQGDMVTVSSFPKSRVTAIRWPKGYPLPHVTSLTTLDPVAPSRGEA